MILVDTGPLVALFDPKDGYHDRCVKTLRGIREPVLTTTPVLTEAFHMLGPASLGSDRLREFVEKGGLSVWFFDRSTLTRAFELMELYADHPMDLADASLVVAAETLGTRKVFTADRKDFETYRVRRGHRNLPMEILGQATGR
jgi:predicted nucleic acid-binding protein